MRVVDEAHHHTPQQVKSYADEAVQIADELGLQGEDRAALLPQIVTLLASKQMLYEQPQVAPLMLPPRGGG